MTAGRGSRSALHEFVGALRTGVRADGRGARERDEPGHGRGGRGVRGSGARVQLDDVLDAAHADARATSGGPTSARCSRAGPASATRLAPRPPGRVTTQRSDQGKRGGAMFEVSGRRRRLAGRRGDAGGAGVGAGQLPRPVAADGGACSRRTTRLLPPAAVRRRRQAGHRCRRRPQRQDRGGAADRAGARSAWLNASPEPPRCELEFRTADGPHPAQGAVAGGQPEAEGPPVRPDPGRGPPRHRVLRVRPRREARSGWASTSSDLLDLKGGTFELAHRNSQASVPFVLSSAGYGFFWHDPSIGRATFGREPHGMARRIQPAARLLDHRRRRARADRARATPPRRAGRR